MKRLFLMGLCLVLAGCKGLMPGTTGDEETLFPIALEYKLTILDASHEPELLQAAASTVERRLEHLGMDHGQVSVDDGSSPTLRVRVSSASGAAVLTQRLADPFSMRFMKEVSVEEANATEGGIVVAEKQGFVDTGLTDEHVGWLSEQTVGSGSNVTIGLTPEGQRLKERIFREQTGLNIGLFVRNQPVYKLTVEAADLATEDIVIMIPDPVLSTVFVDDVNVSNHVIFVPVDAL